MDKLEKESEIILEERTLEQLLKELREEKKWSYWDIVEKLNDLGIPLLDDKKIRKWELGLEYPELEVIYKLSELYEIPSEQFVVAKNNSLKEGMQAIHMTFIKWFCYLTGISLKIGIICMYVFLGIMLIGSLMFFVGKAEEVVEAARRQKGL